jgi:hypothetical protein
MCRIPNQEVSNETTSLLNSDPGSEINESKRPKVQQYLNNAVAASIASFVGDGYNATNFVK